MTATTETTSRERRRQTTIDEILEAAWAQCREDGLASLSLRQLAKSVGMQAPSLYSYFDSKHAIYDAMFQQGQLQLRELFDGGFELDVDDPVGARKALKHELGRWFDFCTADPVRYQLLFQRTIPGFEPSAESYALALEHLDDTQLVLATAGVDDPGALDLFTAMLTGLTSQQIANDPGGDRWARLLDRSVDMFLDHCNALPDPTTGEDT